MGDHVTNCDPTSCGGGGAGDLGSEADQPRGDGVSGEGTSDQYLSSIIRLVSVKEELGVQHVGLLTVYIRDWGCCGCCNPFDATVVRYCDRHDDFHFDLVYDVTFRDVGVIIIVGRFRAGKVQGSCCGGGDSSR